MRSILLRLRIWAETIWLRSVEVSVCNDCGRRYLVQEVLGDSMTDLSNPEYCPFCGFGSDDEAEIT